VSASRGAVTEGVSDHRGHERASVTSIPRPGRLSGARFARSTSNLQTQPWQAVYLFHSDARVIRTTSSRLGIRLDTPDRAMADTEDLPMYTVVDAVPSPRHSPPPPSREDTPFTIGGRGVANPLVSLEQLRSHLRLLGMFASMKQKVEDPDSDPQLMQTVPPLAKALTPEKRWEWFLELAVERCVSVTDIFQMDLRL
jgi:hypothetical protein